MTMKELKTEILTALPFLAIGTGLSIWVIGEWLWGW